jgi:dolichyl-diphosphooligosaccharide--protein glycosyltransferase
MLTLFFGIALCLRIYLDYDQVFGSDWIKFTGIDAYYHMRLVENLLHHFPHLNAFDPYTFYPNGTIVGWPPFFDWFLASIIWVIGLGSPTEHTINVVSVYFPAVLGALTVIPVYFIGKELFGRWAGVLSAGLITLLPGEFLSRSILGFTDHHVAETLFSTTFILFLILSIKAARQRQLTINHIKRWEWGAINKTFIYSLLTGFFLGIYLLSWVGGLLFVFIISVYFVTQFVIDHLRSQNTDYLCIVGTLSFLIASALSLSLLPQTWFRQLYLPSLLIATLIPLILNGISRLMVSKEIKPAYYPLTLGGLGLAGLAIFHIVNPDLLSSMVSKFSYFTPGIASVTITEVSSLLFSKGNFTLTIAWGYFTTSFFLSLIALGILIYVVIKHNNAEKTLLVVWSLMILAATLGQRRFAYYLAINVALLTGYLSWRIFDFISLRRPATEPAGKARKEAKVKAAPKESQKSGLHLTTHQVTVALGVIVVFFLVFYPNIGQAITTAKGASRAPSDAWYASLAWVKENTPDPFGNPDYYYELYEPPAPGESYKYPESAYGIMAWWDYGHWITQISHRIPISNPFQQGASQAARFFTAQDETSANKIMDNLGARYVVIDSATATTKFGAIVTWAVRETNEFYEIYYLPEKGELMSGTLFYPEYYRSLSTRLYNFDGKAVTPENTGVISYEERVSREGVPYKQITSGKQFDSYEEAEAYLLSQESANYKIVSDSPFISPVPLDALEHYRLIHGSDIRVILPDGGTVSAVKIFEYAE